MCLSGEDDWEEDDVYESRLSHYENGKLEALKCTLGKLPPHSKCYKLYKGTQTQLTEEGVNKTTSRTHYNARPASRDKDEDRILKEKYKKAGKAQDKASEAQLTSSEKEALFIEQHGTISVGYLPEARLMLYARNQWVEIDLTAEVGQVHWLSYLILHCRCIGTHIHYCTVEYFPNVREKIEKGQSRAILTERVRAREAAKFYC